jgi:hypothetical protein
LQRKGITADIDAAQPRDIDVATGGVATVKFQS